MIKNIMGWDIGGAHLKAAVIPISGHYAAAYQRPCQLWKGVDKLQQAVREILAEVKSPVDIHVLTMTGELVDLFQGREDGVKRILEAIGGLIPKNKILVYAGVDGLLELKDVNSGHYGHISSANWLASASWAAQRLAQGLFVDIGSTTTDLLVLDKGKVLAQGYSDYERLLSQELVYTGIIRTPVMAVAQSVLDQDKEVGLMAEYFATMADVYRLTGELDKAHDQSDTADGAAKTVEASAKRLARMIGCDYDERELPRWQDFAYKLRKQQIEKIQKACLKQLNRIPICLDAPIIGAGVGRFLVIEIAQNLGHPYVDYSDLFSGIHCKTEYALADCAPAVALAYLAKNNLECYP